MPSRLRLLGAIFLLVPGLVSAGDWPMWRYDAHRSAASPHGLPAKLYLQWARQYSPLAPAWPDQAMMQFDIVREPVVAGHSMFINSPDCDAVRALDTRSGAEKWIFFADGPVRFAPVVWESKVYFTADDGYLYCVHAQTGKLAWKLRGGPANRKILGNERLISTWPARGAPVIDDGKVYFAASIWPFMGIFIHCVDAHTGAIVWTNDGDGSNYMKQPHNTDAFASVAPQGPMVIAGDHLLVPGGRSVPACFDKKTGKLLRYQLADNGKRGGGSEVVAMGTIFFNGGAIFNTDTEKYLADYGKVIVPTKDFAFTWNKDVCRVYDLKNSKAQEVEVEEKTKEKDPPKDKDKDKDKAAKDDKDAKEKAKPKKTKVSRWHMPEVAATKALGVETMIVAGPRVYFGGPKHVTVLDWDADEKKLSPSWTLPINGTVVRMIAADDRLFVATREGGLYCFGSDKIETARRYVQPKEDFGKVPAESLAKADLMLAGAKTRSGYAVVWGVGDGHLVEALARQSALHLIVVEPSAEKVQAFRERWTAANLYGSRIALLHGDAETAQLPPYFASFMVCDNAGIVGATFLAKAYASLRPFGGTMFVPTTPKVQEIVGSMKLVNAKVDIHEGMASITREGPLPGSANWTHENADPANTRVSRDTLVKAPLGVLWF
ncbi:MAG TPA: PQQ-binding-like beta-propeller repeat protein, partial [Gemmataceae bacterium]|nr:PQQ-binding-like beta-propeller repeat protein [Gemmataceae bacterium]